MDELIRGAAKFNRETEPELRSHLKRLAVEGQRPEALLITCVDSRVLPSTLTDARPGSLLTLRNIGNIVPKPEDSAAGGDSSVASTISFAVEAMEVRHVIVMGHSECGGMAELSARRDDGRSDALGRWLQYGQRSLQRFDSGELAGHGLGDLDRLSQLNVLASLEALSQYAEVRRRIDRMQVTLHGWWFDIGAAQVLAYEPRAGRFLPVQHAYESTISEAHNAPGWL